MDYSAEAIRETMVNFMGDDKCCPHDDDRGYRYWTPKFPNLAIACRIIRGAYLMVKGQDLIHQVKEDIEPKRRAK